MANMKIKKRGCYKLNRFAQFLCGSPNPLGENLGHDGISALIRRNTGELFLSLPPLREDSARGWPSANEEKDSYRSSNLPAP